MARTDGYSPVVEARRQVAETVLGDPALLADYKEPGGLVTDLESIRDYGAKAQLANTGQSEAQAGGKAATLVIVGSLDKLKVEYNGIMAAVTAVKGDLERNGGSVEVVAALSKILANEIPVHMTSAGADDATSRRARKVDTQEAWRAEIRKDGQALVDLKEAHAALATRGVTLVRLQTLVDNADALSGKLGARVAKKGASKAATEAERAAVRAQKAVWTACYRLLAIVARGNPRVQALLDAASRTKHK